MEEELNSNNRENQANREKLTGFANWPIWSMITKSMLIEKDLWDLVSTCLRPEQQNPALLTKKVKEDRIAVGIAQQIITEDVSNEIAFNIIDFEEPKEMLDKFKSICTKIGQGVIYSIIQELLNYPGINKPKGYNEPVMQIFSKSTLPIQALPNSDDPRPRSLSQYSNCHRLRYPT